MINVSRTIVIYSSKYGSTENYAKLLGQALGCEACPLESFPWADLKKYDVLVYGGGVYGGKINGLGALKKRWKNLESKRVAIFAVGERIDASKSPDALKNSNFTEDMKNTPLFLMKGHIFREKLRGLDKLVISMIYRKSKNRAVVQVNQEKKQDARAVGSAEIAPLLERVKKWI